MAMIYALGHISGAHFNGAVTFAFTLTRHFPWRRAVVYWVAQLIGALAAAGVLRGSLGNVAHVGATLPAGSQGQSFLWEVVLSAILMFVIMAVATDTRAVGEAAAPGAQQQRRDHLRGGDAGGQTRACRERVGEPGKRGGLHPRACERDDLPYEVETVVAVAQSPECARRGRG